MIPTHINYNLDSLKTDDTVALSYEEKDFVNYPPIPGLPDGELRYYNNWYKINERYYYLKVRDTLTTLFNELLGVEMSLYMHLPTIKYELALFEDSIIGLLSENFRIKGNDFHLAITLPTRKKVQNTQLLAQPFSLTNNELHEELANYIARNYYVNLRDRHANVIYEKVGAKILLGPLYDYEQSFDYLDATSYRDPLFNRAITLDMLRRYINFNRVLASSFERMMEYDIEYSLNKISEEKKIIIPKDVYEYYQELDSLGKKRLMKVLD